MTAKTNLKKYSIFICRFLMFAAILTLVSALMPEPLLGQPTLKEIMKASPEDKKETGQQKTDSKKPDVSLDPLDRGTPRTSVRGFFEAAEERDYEKSAQYLDLRNLPRGMTKSNGPELARHLKIVIDQTVWIDYDFLSSDPEGHLDDGLPSYRDRVCRIKTPKKKIDILVQRVPRDDGVFIWKFSNRTVAQIPRLYEDFGYGYLGEVLPTVFFDYQLVGLPIFMWFCVLILSVFAYLAALIATVLFTYFLGLTKFRPSDRFKRFIARPIRILLALLFLRVIVIELINPSVTARALIEAATLTTIVFTWVVIGLVDFIFDHLSNRSRHSDQQGALILLLPPLRNVAKIIIIIVAVIMWLENIGVQVTTLLAGLGIGGLALALAAQKSIENLIGAVTLYASKPVAVGDFCKFGDTLGTVEEIGLRSTRIRTLDHTLVSVPNAEFMNMHLDNFSKRKKIWFHPRIKLRYETTPEQIRNILNEIKKLLSDHPKVLPDPARVRFTDFGAYSLDLEIFAYINETDYGEYLKAAEDLNLKIMDIVTRAGSCLAIPAQTTYLEDGHRLNEKLTRAAESRGREWGEKESQHE